MPICLLAPLSALTHQSLRLPRGYAWWLIIGVGILDTAAIIAGMLGLATGQVAIVSVLSSLYSVVTIVLAWLFLREKLRWSQWLGIIIILGASYSSICNNDNVTLLTLHCHCYKLTVASLLSSCARSPQSRA